MSGGEILPVAKVLKAAGRAALSEDDVKGELLALAKESSAMRSAADKYARRVAVKQQILLKLYQPLARLLGIAREYFDDEFARDMAKKTAHIPEDRLATPTPSVALPAMQGLSYSLEEPNLKEMYLNLLATATDSAASENAHPSFAEIIKQLSSSEAPLLLHVLEMESLPLARLRRRAVDGQGGTDILKHLFDVRREGERCELPSLPVWVDNWVRLGLVETDYGRAFVNESRYEWIEGRPELVRLATQDERGRESIEIERGILFATDFGQRFRAAVTEDPAQQEDLRLIEEADETDASSIDESPKADGE